MKTRTLLLTLTIILLPALLLTKRKSESDEEEIKKRAQSATDAIWQLSSKIGMNKAELYDLALFIEHTLQEKPLTNTYFRKEETHLPRTVEIDPETKRAYIHLKRHGISHLGTGQHKSVTRSILYDTEKPIFVANCVFSDKSSDEIEATKRLRGKKGVADTYAILRHQKKNGQKVVSIIQKLYNSGSLIHCKKKCRKLSIDDKISVCCDIVRGIESMHKQNLVHCDLHSKNILLHKESKKAKLTACLIDFGHTKNPKKAAQLAPKVQIPRKFNPPDSFSVSVDEIDAKKVDMYAIGINLYLFYFGKNPEWTKKELFLSIASMTPEQKASFKDALTNEILQELKILKKEIKSDSPKERALKKILFRLLDPNPKKRPDAKTCRKKLQKLQQV